ncbi:MAG TPA: heme ABC transporter ATP-binding protein [Dehalococcoidia bacterium]
MRVDDANGTGPVLAARGLRAGYGGREVLRGLDLSLSPGEVLGVVGPNGSGKSTLVRVLSGVLRPRAGTVLLMGRDLRAFSARELARTVAVVPQAASLPEGFTALQIVLMGRTPYLGLLASEGPEDLAAARRAMEQTDVLRLADRPVQRLSGGERQRVVAARALAQEAPVLLLDEPTAHLDVGHQTALFDLVHRLARERRLAVLAVVHDLTLAGQYCDRLLLLKDGRALAGGPPEQVLTPERVTEAYGVAVSVVQHPVTGRPVVLPVASVGARTGPTGVW